MCGILGVMNLDGRPVDSNLLKAMRDTLTHRGPDDAGVRVAGAIGLAHRRLSILDLSAAGHQPMCNEDETLWLVFNGEIYNYVELTRDLKQRGHLFRSQTDSEVILHLYEELGPKCVEKLNGMFAFGLWDTSSRSLFVARDRLGIKPLHFWSNSTRFVFASEIKAILRDPSVPREPDYQGIADCIFVGSPLEGKTPFQGIRSLLPGHALIVKPAGAREHKYWDVEYAYDMNRSQDCLQEQLRELLEDAVHIHCRSDAPVGCHLSGGLDSSVVTSLASRHIDKMKTFTIRFADGGYYDESLYARAVAEQSNADSLVAVPKAEDLEYLLGALVWHLDMPMPACSGFSYYSVSRLAAEHVKVSLTGHGGDEVFAGYPAQFRATFGTTDMFDLRTPQPSAQPWRARLGSAVRRHGLLGTAGRLYRQLRRKKSSLEDQWIAFHCGQPPETNRLVTQGFREALAGYSPRDDYLVPLRQAPTDQTLDKCLYHDLRCYLPSLLHVEDRVSMAVSLESRVPLLDYRLIELMASVPPEQKVPGREPKFLLRQQASKILPEHVAQRRDKRPFPVPTGQWFANEMRNTIYDVLLSQSSRQRGIFNLSDFQRGDVRDDELWTALNIELWFKIFIDQDPTWTNVVDRAARPAKSNRPTAPSI